MSINSKTTIYELPAPASSPRIWIQQDYRIPKNIRLSEDEFDKLWDLHPPQRIQGVLAGKNTIFPRFTADYGESSNFALYEKSCIENNDFLDRIIKFVQEHSGQNYNKLLVNWYENGNDYIGYHNDKGKFVPNSSIYSFSYGQERDFYVRPIPKIECENPSFKLQLTMPNNSMLIMGGNMQNFYQHSVPKRTSKQNPLGRRINITLRLFREDV